MATVASHNTGNASIKRILREARQIQDDPSPEFVAAPLEDNLFDWHCTLRGPKDTEFEGGLYHVRITLPPTYPFRPPSLRVLTPSGRFETDTPICISFTNYHEELWQPAWGIRTAIIGLQGFFPQSGTHAIGVGSLNAPVTERKRLATLSREWRCPHCKMRNIDLLPDPPAPSTSASTITPPTEAPASATETGSPIPPTNSATLTHPPAATVTEREGSTPLATIVVAQQPTESHPPASIDHSRSFQPQEQQRQRIEAEVTLEQPPVQAFPAFRSNAEGVPLWLDSAILILSVLLGGIIAHRVWF